ncbi:UNVERIFIED_CONTAM: hypothetical protein GTU68_035921 [Idotea baltica]|nr:hypothetical protein [Idotea baltica]
MNMCWHSMIFNHKLQFMYWLFLKVNTFHSTISLQRHQLKKSQVFIVVFKRLLNN